MTQANLLGEFLRTRRGQARPADLGLPERSGRRVPGLRRAELAMLAGVSPDYYVRLEQGKRHPSEQVLDALASALGLDEAATRHLHALAGRDAQPVGWSAEQAQSDRLQDLVEQWPGTPAFVTNRRTDVLAANALAQSLCPAYVLGGNVLREIFTNEGVMRQVYVDYDEVAAAGVATLRATAGPHLADPVLSAFVEELSAASDSFRRLWARHDVGEHTEGTKRLRHSIAGPMDFRFQGLGVNGGDGLVLSVLYPQADDFSKQNLAKLERVPM